MLLFFFAFSHSKIFNGYQKYIPTNDSIENPDLSLLSVKDSDFPKFKINTKDVLRKQNGITTFISKSNIQPELEQSIVEKLPFSMKNIDNIMSFSAENQKQFYLVNEGSNYGISGEDINVTASWRDGLSGDKVLLTVVDNGCHGNHSDIKHAFDKTRCWSYNADCIGYNNRNIWCHDPRPLIKSEKGTSYAGVVASSMNGTCGRGIAPNVKLSCINYQARENSVEKAADVFVRNMEKIMVKVITLLRRCSFKEIPLCPQEEFIKNVYDAEYTATKMRRGKGTNIVFPAGDDGIIGGDTQFTLFQRSRYGITVAATTNRGIRASYSNRGCSIFVNAPSGGFHWSVEHSLVPQFVLAPTGNDYSCNLELSGTAVSASIVAGVVSLMLEKNQELTTRDIRYILALTSTKNDPHCPSWTRNAAGLWYSHFYGFGRVNSGRATEMAANWTLVGPEVTASASAEKESYNIPQCQANVLEIPILIESSVHCCESVMLEFSISDDVFGSLHMQVESPSGTVADVKIPSSHVKEGVGNRKVFVMNNFFGEEGNGVWTVKVSGTSCIQNATIINVKLGVFGAEKSTISYFEQESKDPFDRSNWPKKDEISIQEIKTSVQCMKSLKIKLKYDRSLEGMKCLILLINKKTKRQYALGTSTVQQTIPGIRIPCVYSQGLEFELGIEIPSENILVTTPIKVERQSSQDGIISPQRFEILHPSNGTYKFTTKWQMSLDDFPPSEHESMAYIRIVDYPYTRTLKQMYSENTGNVKIELNGNETCAHCLLVISPVYSQMPENCKTMVRPISLQVNGNANPNFAFHEREECRLFNAEKIIPDDNGRFLLLCTFFVALISSSFLYFYSFFKAPKQSQKGQIRL